jgi:hypothetical protein
VDSEKDKKMKLLKLGSAYLNMDLVTDVWVDGGQVNVFFAVPTMYSRVPFRGESNAVTTRQISFYGAEAVALIEWLEQRAQDITPDVGDMVDTGVYRDAHDAPLTDTGTVDDGPTF